ncbi:STAS domain-containing protein [Saccharothrix sp.]|uniref:STAS domain-containing protein n=1 Tax=Saccharothrix sp. TaxID=1873460 RepID=UPI00281209DB|nr:STAS domain-containing protein [Saccharothrix sp.]
MTRSGGPWTRLEVLPERHAVLLRVGGEIEQATVLVLDWGVRQALPAAAQARAERVLLDLDEVVFLGSAGLAAVIRGHHDAARRGVGLVVVVAADHQVARLLTVGEADQVVEIANSVEQALTGR